MPKVNMYFQLQKITQFLGDVDGLPRRRTTHLEHLLKAKTMENNTTFKLMTVFDRHVFRPFRADSKQTCMPQVFIYFKCKFTQILGSVASLGGEPHT